MSCGRDPGREVEPTKALLDHLRCGLTETAYNNTISIGQLKCATEGGMVSELRNYIANLNTSGNIALNITKATAYLKGPAAGSWSTSCTRGRPDLHLPARRDPQHRAGDART